MDEPSVLDYVKSKLTFWRKSTLHLPAPEPKPEGIHEPEAAEAQAPSQSRIELKAANELVPWLQAEALREEQMEPAPESHTPAWEDEERNLPVREQEEGLPPAEELRGSGKGNFPWLTLLALLVALFAQTTLEPGDGERVWRTGLVLYGVVAILLVCGYLRREWLFTPARENADTTPFIIPIYRNTLILGGLLSVATYLAFSGGGIYHLQPDLVVDHHRGGHQGILADLTPASFLAEAHLAENQQTRLEPPDNPLDPPGRHRGSGGSFLQVLPDPAGTLGYDQRPGRETPGCVRYSQRPTQRFFHPQYRAGIYPVLFNRRDHPPLQNRLHLSQPQIRDDLLRGGYLTLFVFVRQRIGKQADWFAGYFPVRDRLLAQYHFANRLVAPVLYFLIRGLRRRKVNDFILSGIFLGIGLNGYSPVRILPFVVVAAVVIYLLHRQSTGARNQTLLALVILAVVAMIFVIPLARYAVKDPEIVFYRTLTRIGTEERAFPGNPVEIFFGNLWSSLIMPFWQDGDVWVNSIPLRPALDVISAALFFIGCVMLLVRYIRKRNWTDLFLLVSIPLLMMSSILSLAFPDENPSLNRSGGAYIPIFIIAAIALDSLLTSIHLRLPKVKGMVTAGLVGSLLLAGSMAQNYDLVFNQFAPSYTQSAWNTAEMGEIVRDFTETYGSIDSAYVVAYAYWVDTRLVGINAGYPTRDLGIWPENFNQTTSTPGAKLFLINTEDTPAMSQLKALYPTGILWLQESKVDVSKSFYVFLVPPS
jgi:hypothetical protein